MTSDESFADFYIVDPTPFFKFNLTVVWQLQIGGSELSFERPAQGWILFVWEMGQAGDASKGRSTMTDGEIMNSSPDLLGDFVGT